MDMINSLGVEEKSSKLAMSNCFTWMGSQSSMMNLTEIENNNHCVKLEMKRNFTRVVFVKENWMCVCSTYQILLLHGFSMYMSLFSINMAEVLCVKQINKSVSAVFFFTSTANSTGRVLCRLQYHMYLSLWVRAKDLSSTLHWCIVIEILLDLLHYMSSPVVGGMSRQS